MKQWLRFAISILPICSLLLLGQKLVAQDSARDDAPPAMDAGTVKLDPNYRPPVSLAGGLLYDNGPFVNLPGGGNGGADASVLQTSLSMLTFGFQHDPEDAHVADDFTVTDPAGWTIDSLVFYSYQTLSGNTSTTTALYYQIWDGPPNDPGSTVIFGDLTTNRLAATTWSNTYRVNGSTLLSTDRPIMKNTSTGGATLSTGTYWIEWATEGTLISGPWAPPITINGQTTTGNALQKNIAAGTWAAIVDAGTLTPQGLPFLIYGALGDPLAQFGVSYGSTGSSNPDNPGTLITIDPLTGAGTLIGPTGIIGDDGPAVRALAIKSTGEMYALSYKASSDLYSVNASTGASTLIANTGLLHPGDIVFDANDVLYAVDETNILYTVDPVTGLRTVVGATGVTLGGLAYDPTDGTVYGSDNNDRIYTINVTTGAATLIGTTGLGGNTPDILFDQAGNLFGVKTGAGGISNYISIDKITGAGTVIGPTGIIAVVGLASRVLSTPLAMPVTIKVEIDSLHQFVPAEGDTFAYTMTFTNHTGKTQVFDWWTKLLRPQGPIDPLSGPHSLSLSRFQTVVIDTALLRVPFSWETGDYSLVGYVGTYAADTVDADTASFSKLAGGPLALFGVSYGSTGSAEPSHPGALIRIDPVTGAGTLIGPTGIIGDDGPSVRALAVKSTGEMYALNYKASSDLYTVNASTGAATFVANTGLLRPGDIIFNASDILYAVDETNILFTVDPVTGARTVVGPTGVTLGGLACDPTDGTIYGSDNTDGIYTINVTTGAATLVGTTGLGGNTPDILFDQAGNLFGAKSGTGGISNYIAIDKTTGAGTVIGPTGFVAVIGLASRVLIATSTIPCTDITSMAARCIGGGVKTIQVRVNLLNNIIHVGEEITIAIDENQFTSTIITNGTHSRANFSVPGWSVGDHVVSLVDPSGCLADKHANCVAGDDIAKADPYWDDDAEWMATAQEVPQATTLLGNYPNPFNPSSNIQYALSEDAHVTLRVYNMLGQLVATLVDEPQTAGYKSVVWNGKNESGVGVASGIYIYRMTAGNSTATKRMLLLK